MGTLRFRAASVLFATGLLACGASDKAKTPEAAVRALIAAARAGDRSAVFRRLGPSTRGLIESQAGAARRLSGRVPLKPEDFLSVGWAPPAWEATGMRVTRKDDQSADVDVFSAAGDRHALTLVREGGDWKVELPVR